MEPSGSSQPGIVLLFARAQSAEDAALTLESAPAVDSPTWTPVTGTMEILPGANGQDSIHFRPVPPPASASRSFYRLRATLP